MQVIIGITSSDSPLIDMVFSGKLKIILCRLPGYIVNDW